MKSILSRSLLSTVRGGRGVDEFFVHQQREPNTPRVWTLRAYWCNSRVDAHRSPMVLFFVLLSSSRLYFLPISLLTWWNMCLLSFLLLFLYTHSSLSGGGRKQTISIFVSVCVFPSPSKYTSSILENIGAWLGALCFLPLHLHDDSSILIELDEWFNSKFCLKTACKRTYNWINYQEWAERQRKNN